MYPENHSDETKEQNNAQGSAEHLPEDNYSELLKSLAPRGVNPKPLSSDSIAQNKDEKYIFDDHAPLKNNGEVYFSSTSARRQIAARDSGRRNEQSGYTSAQGYNTDRRNGRNYGSNSPVFANGTPRHHSSAGAVHASDSNSGEAYRQRMARLQHGEVPVVPTVTVRSASRKPSQNAAQPRSSSPSSPPVRDTRGRTDVAPKRREASSKENTSKEKPKKNRNAGKVILRLLTALLILVIIIGASTAITMVGISCGNDIFAVGKSTDIVTVEISENMRTPSVIDLLSSKGLIDNLWFCQKIAPFLGYDGDEEYVAGTYYLTSNWGLEKMLNEMMNSGEKETVTLTFPEGYTVDRIAEKLESYDVCTASAFFDAINHYDFSSEYTFLASITDKNLRYRILEGYLYPDTYDFFVGENATSVVKKFLENFTAKWTNEYADRAAELGLSMDKVVILASIVEKEGNDADQMRLVSSVLHNRLNNLSVFTNLQCDSTRDFVSAISDEYVNDIQRESLNQLYDTYIRTGYPVGAICNPGNDAINSVLYPDETDFYYFRHDKKGQIYMARTQEEHDENGRMIDSD